jgi:hypothetical protein
MWTNDKCGNGNYSGKTLRQTAKTFGTREFFVQWTLLRRKNNIDFVLILNSSDRRDYEHLVYVNLYIEFAAFY